MNKSEDRLIQLETVASPFHVLANPVGSLCNLDCKYCYYLEKENLYKHAANRVMPDEVLRNFIRQYILGQNSTQVNFLWQGGEPTLAGIEFFEKVIEIQSEFSTDRTITNSLQSNATLVDAEFALFLKKHNFLVGVSIDGPPELHDPMRPTKGGGDSFDSTLRGLQELQKADVDVNILCVVHAGNVGEPQRVYEFLKSIGGRYLQFLPLVERLVFENQVDGLRLALPNHPSPTKLMPNSVEPRAFGNFLSTIFDLWTKKDIGKTFVQIFDVTLENWLGFEPSLCIFRTTCGDAVALEKNGDVYSCDHYVFPNHLLGNIENIELREMVNSPQQKRFGTAKRDALPKQCLDCDVYFACKGECPKNRFAFTEDGEPGLNYLCQGYKHFFRHVAPQMNRMASVIDPTFAHRHVKNNLA